LESSLILEIILQHLTLEKIQHQDHGEMRVSSIAHMNTKEEFYQMDNQLSNSQSQVITALEAPHHLHKLMDLNLILNHTCQGILLLAEAMVTFSTCNRMVFNKFHIQKLDIIVTRITHSMLFHKPLQLVRVSKVLSIVQISTKEKHLETDKQEPYHSHQKDTIVLQIGLLHKRLQLETIHH
jgi:hypothetical protein